ncbi:MAG: transcriptional coactivator p15/PC4 family protein [Patescibacteria group bacterium]|jgi:hypothetical protein
MDTQATPPAEEKILATVQKSETDVIKIRETEFKGKVYVDIRIYTKTADGTEIPTKKGVMVTKEIMKQVRDELDKVEL